MEVLARTKFIRLSSIKARPIANLVRGKNAKTSVETLKLMPQKSAKQIAKTIMSAMANAENNFNLDKNNLTISSITIDAGPVLKRMRPRAKGAASAIRKRTSHITVIVSGELMTKKSASEKKEEKKAVSVEDNHKMEVERPDFVKKEKAAPKVNVKNTMFRRKTG